jgi:hypothetical protein
VGFLFSAGKRVFLQGVFTKAAFLSWYFDGENVVECVINVVD